MCQSLIDFSKKVTHGPTCLHHYLRLGGRQWQVYIEGKPLVNLKKYLYVVRPAMAIRWISMHPDIAPPMNFHELQAGIDLPDQLSKELQSLLERKSVSKELGEGPRAPIIDAFITSAFAWAQQAVKEPRAARGDLEVEANALLRSIVKGE